MADAPPPPPAREASAVACFPLTNRRIKPSNFVLVPSDAMWLRDFARQNGDPIILRRDISLM